MTNPNLIQRLASAAKSAYQHASGTGNDRVPAIRNTTSRGSLNVQAKDGQSIGGVGTLFTGPGWSNRHVVRMAAKRRNVLRNKRAHRKHGR